jgi:phosphate transport system substrate-binding protein
MDLNSLRTAAGLLVVLILAAACGGASGPSGAPATGGEGSPGGGSVSGEVFVTGSSTVEPISLAVSEAFTELNPDLQWTVEGPGTSDGFADFFCTGEADVANASRQIRDTEVAQCQEAGVEFVELKVAYDGITVFTHPDTALECVTFEDLYALFGPESSDFATWEDAQALATELGSTTQFPTGNLAITAPGDESGTYGSFIELVTAGIAEDRLGEDDPNIETLGTHYTPSPNDNVIVENVAGTPGSLGFAGYAFYEGNQDSLKALQVDGGEGCVAPTTETIADGSYPISRPLFIYPSTTNAAENPALVAWVDYFLSDEGIQNVSAEGYIPLPAEELEATRQAWQNR